MKELSASINLCWLSMRNTSCPMLFTKSVRAGSASGVVGFWLFLPFPFPFPSPLLVRGWLLPLAFLLGLVSSCAIMGAMDFIGDFSKRGVKCRNTSLSSTWPSTVLSSVVIALGGEKQAELMRYNTLTVMASQSSGGASVVTAEPHREQVKSESGLGCASKCVAICSIRN